ncbi:GIY-YIG nuclease family protein [Streptomyces sparsogenes]|uniref:GIY-YIG nuclease family protein n=1 Tax=Streptomyces sparsogenes TaxID=67365 RepID=UPI00340696CC
MNAHDTEEPGYGPSVSPQQESKPLPRVSKRQESVKVPTTYLVGMEGSPLVKIGFTSGNPKKRLASLQTGQPMKLWLLWSSDGNHESALHRRFAQHRVRGEWFDLTPLGDPVQVVKDAIRFPDEDLTIPKQTTPARTQGAQKPIGVALDCVCGHGRSLHRCNRCTVAGSEEWRDCQCAEYTSTSVLESAGPLTRVYEPRPVTTGWQGPTPFERLAAREDVRYDALLAEIAGMVWPGGGQMVPGYWPERLATDVLWRLSSIEDSARHPAVVLGEIVRMEWLDGAAMVPGLFAERLTDRITACLTAA